MYSGSVNIINYKFLHKKVFDKELLLSVSLLSLMLCASIAFFLFAAIFYSKSAKSEDVDTEVVVYMCGNNIRENVEVCDGTDLNGQFCQSLGYDFGILGCMGNCKSFDTSQCHFANTCGNGVQEVGELCDGNDLNSQSCISFGYDGGTLVCASNCASYIFDGCSIEEIPTSFCGNNKKESGEICDGFDLGGSSCMSFGYDYGTLSCKSDCSGFVTSGCKKYPATPAPKSLCGNQALDKGEVCDGALLDGETCVSLGYDAGNLGCNPNCRGFDVSECYTAVEICDNGIDDDKNGFVDCYDLGCMATDYCLSKVTEVCFNGIDDNNNTFIDCYDSECLDYEYCLNKLTENCGNGVDDNGNGLVDCDDPACFTHQLCYEKDPTEEPGEEIPGDELPETGEEPETRSVLKFGLLIGLLVLIALIIFFIIWKRRKKKEEEQNDEGDSSVTNSHGLKEENVSEKIEDENDEEASEQKEYTVSKGIEPDVSDIPLVIPVDEDEEESEWTFVVELLPDGQTLEIPEGKTQDK